MPGMGRAVGRGAGDPPFAMGCGPSAREQEAGSAGAVWNGPCRLARRGRPALCDGLLGCYAKAEGWDGGAVRHGLCRWALRGRPAL